jgi:hypothetical protein
MNKSLLFLVASFSLSTPLHAQIEPPPTSPAPSSTTSGGTRPAQACLKSTLKVPQRLIALNASKVIGFTQSDRPTLSIYIPRNTAQFLELSLFDEQKQGLYQTTLSIQNQSGLIGLPLPNDAPKLVKGKNYYWTVAVVCNINDRTEDQIIGGWIQYRDLPENVSRLLPLERVKHYADQGFWYDAFKEWSDLNLKQPNHPAVKESWANLIQAIGLSTSLLP